MSSKTSTGPNAAFSNRVMKDLVGFNSSYVQSSCDCDINGTTDIETNNTPVAFLNGVCIPVLAADTGDLSAILQGSIWLTAQSYTAGMLRYVVNADGKTQQWICLLDHTSSATNKPGIFSGEFETMWKKSSSTAENAGGYVIAAGKSQYFLMTADVDGNVDLWVAGLAATDGSEVLMIPNFEPELFIPVGIMHINSAAGTTLGTTNISGEDTYYNLVGPVFPGTLYRDNN